MLTTSMLRSLLLIFTGDFWQREWPGWHVFADLVTALASYAVPLTLVYMVKQRRDLPSKQFFGAFGLWAIASGTSSLIAIWTLWYPDYGLTGLSKTVTAIAAVALVIVLGQSLPQVLALPNLTQLTALNDKLEQQIADRKQAEAQLQQLTQDLEAQVARRTTELKDSMVQMRAHADRATLAMAAAQMGSWDWDMESETVTWDAYHETLLGYPIGQPEWRYEDWSRRVHPDDLAATEANLQAAIANRSDYAAEYRVIWEDGSLHWLAACGRFYFDASGQPVRMLGILQDITDRKAIEAELQLSEEQLRLATEAADLGMWFWNLETSKLVFTPRTQALFNLNLEGEMSYEKFLAALDPADRDRTAAAIEQAIATRSPYVAEYRTQWHDGSKHWILATGRAFYDDHGKPLRMMGIVQDIDAVKQAEADRQARAQELSQLNCLLLQATTLANQRNQELDQFTHVVSHDLKAPLRAIANLTTWIETDLAEQATGETKQNLTLLRSRVQRMDALISGLLAYAHVSYDAAPRETFALNELLAEIIDSIAVPAQFTIVLPDPLTLTTSRLLLNQVLTNLISNAIKHHHRPDGRVQIDVHYHQQHDEFVIADDGPGIAPTNHDRVFEVFQTLTSRDKTENTGIGLAIVKKIVLRAGGQIAIASHLGQGTTLRFTWPHLPHDRAGS